MKVIEVTASASPLRAGGLYDAVRRLSQSLAKGETSVDVFALNEGDEPDAPAWSPARLTLFPRSWPKGLGRSPRLQRELARAGDTKTVIHSHGLWLWSSRACLVASRRRGAPRVISPHGMMDTWALRRSRWKKTLVGYWYEYENLRSADALHALCHAERDSMRAFGLRNPVAVIPNGVDLPDDVSPAATDPAPEDWSGHPVLLFLARVHPKKGLVPLIEGWREAKMAERGWRLAIAGPDEVGHAAEIRGKIDAAGLEKSIRLVGPVFGANKDAWLRRSTAFVLPSFSEGFSMAVLEALAYRRPALLTPECNFPEAVAMGAALVAHPSPASLADGLDRLTRMGDEERREMGVRGRELVAREYTWPIVAAKMKSMYEWLLGSGPRPTCVEV